MEEPEPHLDKERHISYWRRCLLSLLPTQYTSTDSTRMTLGFFILSALDLLSAGSDTFPTTQRNEIRKWILKCQHPHGGFCGSPNHRYPNGFYSDGKGEREKEIMDPANLPATFFAIMSLGFVGGLEGVKRVECLEWLARLQRSDGSFGELITVDGKVQGGHDMRYCYVASAIRWMLRGDVPAGKEIEGDIDVEGLVGHLRNGQSYDGGISESLSHEAHSGYTYCAIASLAFLNRLPENPPKRDLVPGLTNIPATIRWLVSRQVGYREEDEESEDEDEVEDPLLHQRQAMMGIHSNPSIPGLTLEDEEFVGFNGRCNKNVDTCYAFWVTASLDMLGEDKAKLVNAGAIRRFLFAQTQHRIGGFGKHPGDPPDIYHSYLGLAALAVMNEPGLKSLDSALCVSKQQKEMISRQRETGEVPRKVYWKHGYPISIREDNSEFKEKMASGDKPPKFLQDIIKPI